MYQLDLASLRGALTARTRTAARPAVAGTVWLLGIVSALTDISSEMVASVLPAYLFVHLQLSPIHVGLIDGLYQGVTALARIVSGVAADRSRRYKLVAASGYALSAISKVGLLAVGGSWTALAAVISADRLGKGIRTAPRDALISLASHRRHLAAAFGVHRALDALGVLIGPLAAFVVLRLAPGRYDALFVVSFAVAVVGLAVLLLLVDDPTESGARTSLDSHASDLCRDARVFTIATAAAMASIVVISDAFLYLLLQWRAGLRAETIPLLYVGSAVAYFVCAAPLGRWADRFGRVGMFIAGHVCVLVVYAALAWSAVAAWGVVVCLTLHGIYYAATDGVLASIVSDLTPSPIRASALAAVTTATSLARLGGSVVVGVIWAWRGPQAVAVAAVIGLIVSITISTLVLPTIERKAAARG